MIRINFRRRWLYQFQQRFFIFFFQAFVTWTVSFDCLRKNFIKNLSDIPGKFIAAVINRRCGIFLCQFVIRRQRPIEINLQTTLSFRPAAAPSLPPTPYATAAIFFILILLGQKNRIGQNFLTMSRNFDKPFRRVGVFLFTFYAFGVDFPSSTIILG